MAAVHIKSGKGWALELAGVNRAVAGGYSNIARPLRATLSIVCCHGACEADNDKREQ
jgi:hypothetical protein